MASIADRVKRKVAFLLGVDIAKVTDGASLADDLGADSLDMAELLYALEAEFGVEISDEAAEAIVTVGDAITFLSKAAGASAG